MTTRLICSPQHPFDDFASAVPTSQLLHFCSVVDADMQLLEQEEVDKAMIFDYARAVEPSVECWLGLIRSKLLAYEYDYPDQMVRDVDKIRKCAEQYHGKRHSKFRNPGQCWRNIFAYLDMMYTAVIGHFVLLDTSNKACIHVVWKASTGAASPVASLCLDVSGGQHLAEMSALLLISM